MHSNFTPNGPDFVSRPASIHSDMSNANAQIMDEEPPRKRVRKGTKSCWECKRRKVKCQLSSEDVPVCSGCLARGTSCLSQEFPEERDSAGGLQVGERLGRVERLLETLVAKISAYEEEENSHKILTPESMSNDVLSEGTVEVHATNDASPFLSLFDNPVIGHATHAKQPTTPAATSGTRTPTSRPSCGRLTKTERLRQTLLQLMPSQADMDLIYSTSYFSILMNAVSWSSMDTKDGNLALPFNVAEVEKQSPTTIARTLLYVAVSLQQIDPNFDHSQLHIQPSPKVRTERILSTVNALITSDDELATSMEGIECLILQGMLSINDGSPRRAWLIYRRALNLGQLMGLEKKSSASAFPRGRSMWHQLVLGDRYLSLLLGLPAGSHEDKYEPEENFQNPDIDKEDLFSRKLGGISLRIIQRNQAGSTPAYTGTQEIDDMLDSLAGEMSASWWEIPSQISDDNSKESTSSFDRLMTQIWFFQIQGLVHLPFMLRASTERRYEYSRFSCLKACREVMWRYIAMRKSYNKSFCCKIIDFGALTATVALFLGVLDPQHSAGTSELPQQNDADRSLINMVLQTMEEFSQHGNEIVAAQSVSIIKSLLEADHPKNQNGGNLRLTIPYFGTVSIVRPSLAQSLTPTSQVDTSSTPQTQSQNTSTYQGQQQNLTISHDGTSSQTWPNIQVPHQNALSFPTVSFQSSYFNQSLPQQPSMQNFSWEEADTLLFDSLLNADIEGNWSFQ